MRPPGASFPSAALYWPDRWGVFNPMKKNNFTFFAYRRLLSRSAAHEA
jgi:hypothetical protein